MSPPKPEYLEFSQRFGIASQIFQSILQTRLATQGLTTAQLSVLSHLARQSAPQRVTDIARLVDVGQPAVTKMMAKFETAGWVRFVTDDADRRSKAAVITPEGAQYCVGVQRSLFPELPTYMAGLDPETLKQFTQLLKDFGGFLDRCRRVDGAD